MALNPIIEAFLAAREQASRDFAQDQNRVLAREQMSEEAKRQQELFKQQTELQRVNLAQEKTLRDAEHKLREMQLKEHTLLGNRQQSLGAGTHLVDMINKGMISPYKTDLLPGQNVQVGQIGQMEDQLTQIPSEAPQTGLVPNTAGFENLFPGGAPEARAVIEAAVPRDVIRQQMIDDLEIKKTLELQAALEKEQGIFDIKKPLEQAKLASKEKVAEAERLNRAQIAADRDKTTLMAAAMRASKKASTEGVTIDPQAMGGFIDGSYNLDDFVKQFATAKERTAAATAFRSEGFKFLAKPEQKLLDRAGIIAETARNAQELANLYKDGYVKNFSKIRAKNAAIESVLGNLARGVSGEAGVLTQADIERIKGIIPSFSGSMIGKMNQDQVNQLNKYVKNTFGHVFYNMRDDQAKSIVNKYGLANSGIYSPAKKPLLDKPPE